MVNSYLLAKVMKYNNFSITELARVLNISKEEVEQNLKKGVWKSNEIEMMLHIFKWTLNPFEVFFSTYNADTD